MATTLVLQPAHHARMQVHSFRGDQAHLLDKLIASSHLKEVPAESLQERTLVPFFDSSDVSSSSHQALQPSHRPAPTKALAIPAGKDQQAAHGLKRHAHEHSSTHLAGSPPKKEPELVQAKHLRRGKQVASAASSASSGVKHAGSTSDTEMSLTRKPRAPGSMRKHQHEAGARATAPSGSSQRQSPPHKHSEHPQALAMHHMAAASAAAASALHTPGKAVGRVPPMPPSKFAGPAFTNSPTPDCLPIPTSSLLLQEAADSLRSRLTL